MLALYFIFMQYIAEKFRKCEKLPEQGMYLSRSRTGNIFPYRTVVVLRHHVYVPEFHDPSCYSVEYNSVYPLVGIGTTLPRPSPSSERVTPPPPPTLNQRRREHIRLRVREWRSPNSDDMRKSLALWLPCLHSSIYH